MDIVFLEVVRLSRVNSVAQIQSGPRSQLSLIDNSTGDVILGK